MNSFAFQMYFSRFEQQSRNTEMKVLVKETESHIVVLLFGLFLFLLFLLLLSCK